MQKSAIDDEVVAGKIISPIAGQFFEKDSLIAHFIVYSEHKPIENFSIRDAQFQQGEMQDWSASVFTIIGEFRKRPFKVEFSESDAMILISVEGKNQAVLSLINTNPTSLSSGGVRLSKNKRFIVGNATQSKVEVGEAEWYPIYVVEDVDDAAVTEMSFILMLLFFAVGQSG